MQNAKQHNIPGRILKLRYRPREEEYIQYIHRGVPIYVEVFRRETRLREIISGQGISRTKPPFSWCGSLLTRRTPAGKFGPTGGDVFYLTPVHGRSCRVDADSRNVCSDGVGGRVRTLVVTDSVSDVPVRVLSQRAVLNDSSVGECSPRRDTCTVATRPGSDN